MEFTILGSGGAMPVPRPFCQCKLCNNARNNPTSQRNSCSIFLNDINTLIDCPEDIGESINRENIKQIDHLFLTHWHPDHTFGLRVIAEAIYDFIERKPTHEIKLYTGKKVYETLKEKFPTISYYIEKLKVFKLNLVEDGDILNINNIKIKIIGFQGKESDWYVYHFEENNKKLVYAPCDTLHFKNYINHKDIDVLVHECGIFSHDKVSSEISFPNMIKRFKEITPKKVILTHIEEIELNRWGLEHLDKLKEEYPEINFEYAHDGMKINL